MNQFSQFLVDAISEDFGRPAKLLNLLNEWPDIRVPIAPQCDSIASDSVVRWHELGMAPAMEWPGREHGHLLGWKLSGGHYYESFVVQRPEFAQFGRRVVVKNWSCDIKQVYGFSASGSDLKKFRSMDEMAERKSQELISEVSPQALARNLSYHEVRILRPDTDDSFQHHQWDSRLFLMNSGGSHHFAAAKYIAARLDEPVPLTGPLHAYSLNPTAIASLRRDFDIFVISDEPAISGAFHDAMASFRATWLWTYMPRPYDNSKAILLPKNERRSQRVASVLRNAGIVDLGAYLEELACSGNALFPPTAIVAGLATYISP
ncbi:hypothetical protein HSX11_18685 [Oxalobacteraceae bacterium]|nr:hypothetical protein [Oxalobacteraceae bacterium]